jgi:hypothetical protein
MFLSEWFKQYGSYPEELYIQFDGGSENANKTVMAFLEWLVARRATKTILYSRLPTGHTHEDVDRTFSVLWNFFRGRIVHTPQEYRRMMYEAYNSLSYRVQVDDIYSVPDYMSWLEPHIGRMERLHKLELTQHQFR